MKIIKIIISLYYFLAVQFPFQVSAQQLSVNNGATNIQPIIDVHRHAGSADSLHDTLSEMDSLGIVLALVCGPPSISEKWAETDPQRLMAGVLFPCPGGRVPNGGSPCFAHGGEFPSVEYLRNEFRTGKLKFMGEITAQYDGISPADPRLEAYYSLAEDLNVPVFIHLSLAPPGTPYACCPAFRSSLGNPLLLEDVLVRHPGLRIVVMHAGYPYLEEMKALMLVYPQVYVDVAAIDQPFIIPRKEFYMYLQGLTRAGLGKRILFGSDYSPIRTAVQSITDAPFLSLKEKQDILYNNAIKFLELDGSYPESDSDQK